MAWPKSVLVDGSSGMREFFGDQNGVEVRLRYTLRRSERIRRLSIAVTMKGEVLARAPKWTPIYMVDQMLEEHLGWIEKQLGKMKERQCQHRVGEADSVMACKPEDGGYVPFLGRRATIRLGAIRMHYDETTHEIHLPLAKEASELEVRDMLKSFMCEEAIARFSSHLEIFKPQLQILPTKWQLSNAQTRWGVCTSRRHIRVSWRLMFFAPAVARYVLAHELAHLVHPNHSEYFWKETERLDPEMKKHRTTLRRWAMSELPDLG